MVGWFSKDELSNKPWDERPGGLQGDPLFVTAEMIDQIRGMVLDVVVANPSEAALAQSTNGMVFDQMQTKAAGEMLGVGSHKEAAALLTPVLRRHLASAA